MTVSTNKKGTIYTNFIYYLNNHVIAMSEEKKASKSCNGKNKAMLAYGIIQLGSTFVSALALVAISFGFCSLKKESKFFNECVEEIVSTGSGKADAVRFCNGG
tara:strand:+ start:199 stop:507 length:309 start_codon:yes stop_codon:yes gene_type:complete